MPKVLRAKFLGSERLCFISTHQFGLAASRTLSQQLLPVACLKFLLDSEDLFCWYNRKKWFLAMNYGSRTSRKNHGDEWGLTWCLQWGIYSSIQTWTHSQNSLAAAQALPHWFLLEKNMHQYPWKNDHHTCESHVYMSDINRNVHKIGTVQHS